MQTHDGKTAVAIIGSGNIGTDLMVKILRHGKHLRMGAFVGIDPESDGLKRAERMGVPTVSTGIEGLLSHPDFGSIGFVFDATSAGAHARHEQLLRPHGVRVIDLTPAAIGPFVVPAVNIEQHLDAPNVNMVTCGGQATIPMVAAVSRVVPVEYAEIVASISSRSAGPGTRANIDEFTETTSNAIVRVGGAQRGKAIIILNPAEPPLIMRDTVYCLVPGHADRQAIVESVERMASAVAAYVPGYRLKQTVQFDEFKGRMPQETGSAQAPRLKVSVFLEVEGAGHYLPSYAGNLDIMTSAALATAERIAARQPVAA
ncbi:MULTISPECIES: acetaldehyde dehydrogenase (acetylating) [Pseudomonas]|jgi:acetaldehyde dehydrogenase|uniref:Acetaldehyde dehydrogenase 2 n=4 Tax=Pseudomonas putida group TaxID=136845 RepID=ACDH2_PSEP1|nr:MULTISPECIES: acetaldehyde dehydrogenase (acetylating) [Pseudomonas]A5W4F9.1 RecName: Full=Acetaldehyde dehydrogenase 2; AltName: Full=Acetaldehyde dehydrogenase [acetylating] 2 [Pseudomonas putida F1]AAB62294.1 acetaldehyde dehydrogenase [Pseudomonas putida]ABA10803.1 acetaldehyde dehydrogenase [Pseudomonas putida]ADI95392.1 CmtH [Pseudomonas putida DOT-T1E]AFO50086.1 acetaldehyde dehydrogenase [Pseudomonas putida DOT-T1E]AHC82452.1 acetaldehyde dehydrogenase [Pseudomonas monteilii SB3078